MADSLMGSELRNASAIQGQELVLSQTALLENFPQDIRVDSGLPRDDSPALGNGVNQNGVTAPFVQLKPGTDQGTNDSVASIAISQP